MTKLSILIPVGPADRYPHEFVQSICKSFEGKIEFEILICGPQVIFNDVPPTSKVKFCFSKIQGRVPQLNQLVHEAQGQWFWFVHADSLIDSADLSAFLSILSRVPIRSVGYFKLRFVGPGSFLCTLNAWGANFRSYWFKIPFGDQGIFTSRDFFYEVGFFSSEFLSSEDHAWVQRARRRAAHFVRVPGYIRTSARKYQRHGWLATTLNHLKLTLRQEWQK